MDCKHQQVLCNGAPSPLKLLKFGVPQGFFVISYTCINDIPNASTVLSLISFADDKNGFCSHESYDELVVVEIETIN